ncbi:gluconokinase [Dyella jejuensis]|uniref:Gluconokinase n=2 Tax=Dyella jejuensis TaxID=1432009 RepID=A0ABW8JJ75_9GAMM
MQEKMRAIVIMGVAGCGKSTIAQAMCRRIGAVLIEGDDFHSSHNIQKMRAGTPLTDEDRKGWLQRLAQATANTLSNDRSAILACSALKRTYRDILRGAVPQLGCLYLELTPAQAAARVAHRSNHFMPASLIDSQFRDLEPPYDEPLVLTAAAVSPIDDIVDAALAWWARINDSIDGVAPGQTLSSGPSRT